MGLGANVAEDWDGMKNLFLAKNKDYCRGSMGGDDIFKMQQKEDEILEDYASRFLYNLQRSTEHDLNESSQKHLFLRGVEDTCVQALDLIARGDITQSTWEDIKRYYKNQLRANVKKRREIILIP